MVFGDFRRERTKGDLVGVTGEYSGVSFGCLEVPPILSQLEP